MYIIAHVFENYVALMVSKSPKTTSLFFSYPLSIFIQVLAVDSNLFSIDQLIFFPMLATRV